MLYVLGMMQVKLLQNLQITCSITNMERHSTSINVYETWDQIVNLMNEKEINLTHTSVHLIGNHFTNK